MKSGYSLRGRAATNGGVSTGERDHAMVSKWLTLCGVEGVESDIEFEITMPFACKHCCRKLLKQANRQMVDAAEVRA